MTVGLIVATDPNGIIGIDGRIPWSYPSDLRRFKALTMGGVLIMGRKTWESIGRRHLPGRLSLVISSVGQPDVETCSSLEMALERAPMDRPVWVIGGAQVYRDVLERGLVDFAEVTMVPPVSVPEGARDVAIFPVGLLSSLPLSSATHEAPLEYRRYNKG